MNNYSKILDKILYKYINDDSCYFMIMEGINEIKRYFPKLNDEQLKTLIKLDPTYRGGEQLGKYGQWIIKLYYNNIKNIERRKQYNDFMREHPDGINPKNGNKITPPQELPAIKKEDLYKITNSLKEYELLKNKIKMPIDSFKTLPDLDAEISKFKNSGVPTNKKALERYNCFQNCIKKGLKKIYEDNQWIIGIPETLESSVPFGEYTSWCTTSAHGNYYNAYTKDGPLFILLNKVNGDLFQFHFESSSFMNEYDRRINMDDFTSDFINIAKFLHNYINKEEDINLDEKSKRIIKRKEEIEKFFSNPSSNFSWLVKDWKDIKIEGDNIIFNLSFDDLQYFWNSESDVSFNWVNDFLYEPYEKFSFWSDYNLSDITYEDIPFNKACRNLGMDVDLDKLIQVYNYDDVTDINNLIDNDWYDERSALNCFTDAKESGTIDTAEKDIFSQLEDYLPPFKIMDNETLQITITKEDFYHIYYIYESGPNYINDEIGNFSDEIQREFEFNVKPDFTENWYKLKNKHNDNDNNWDYYDNYESNWGYLYNEYHGREYSLIEISEPYYGWDGFDDDSWKEACESAAKKLKEIIGDKSFDEFVKENSNNIDNE